MAEEYEYVDVPVDQAGLQSYPSYQADKRMDSILEQINPDNLIVEIEHRIKGFRKDTLTKQWVAISGKQKVISEELVANFVSFLSSFLTNNTTLSNFSDKEINRIMIAIKKYVTDDLRTNAILYNLEHDYSERTRIGLIICATVFTTLKRAQSGMEASRIFKSINIGEHLGGGQQQKGFGDALKFWK